MVKLTLADPSRLIATMARDAFIATGADLGLSFGPAQAQIFPV